MTQHGTLTATQDRWILVLHLDACAKLTQEVRAPGPQPDPWPVMEALAEAVRPIVEHAGVVDALITVVDPDGRDIAGNRVPGGAQLGDLRVLDGKIYPQVAR